MRNSLDPALLRPGRLDLQIPVPLPDVRGRANILRVHSKSVIMDPKVDLSIIARGTPGLSGADLSNLINQAALNATKEGVRAVRMHDLEFAKDKLLMGSARKSAIISPKEKLMTAYHEGGHTLVSMFTKGATPLYKVTVLPRGGALGVTYFLPEMDVISISKQDLLAMLDVAMGGRVAEELIYGPELISTGASNDLSQATRIARQMVNVGFSDLVGLASYTSLQEIKDIVSDDMKKVIDQETKRLLDESYERSRKLLIEHKDDLEKLAKALVEYETLGAEEIKTVLAGGVLNKMI